MDKRGALYFKLISVLLALVLTAYAAARLFAPAPAYTLQSVQVCKVGDGESVSGFVVRSEKCLTSSAPVVCALSEGQRVGGGQAVAESEHGALTVTQAGYFSRVTDGYEALLTPEFVQSASLSELEALVPAEISTNAFGRLIEGQTWYFAAVCPERELEVGQGLMLCFEGKEFEMQVLRTDGLLLLSCDTQLHAVTALREIEAELIFETYEGLRVPKHAVYYEDGEACVYVLQGARVRRKQIEILYMDENDVLVRGELPEGAQLILTQIELTDGMVLQ